jgi:glycosyltransferase 2 family protein
MKRWQSILLGIVISIATLAFAMQGTDFSKLGGELAKGRYIYLIPAFAMAVLGLWLRAVRWKALLNHKITLNHSFSILNASYLFNTILPLRLGEVVRSYMVTRLDPPISMFTSLSTVVVERLVDVLTVVILIVIGISGATVSPQVAAGVRTGGIVAVIGVIVLAIFAARRNLAHQMLDLTLRLLPFLKRFNLTAFMDRVLDGIAPLGNVQGAGETFIWTAVSWVTSILTSYATMLIFYDSGNLNAAMLLIAFAALAIAVPAVPGGVGPFEAGVVFALSIVGMTATNDPTLQTKALAFAVVLHLVSVISYVVLGFVGLQQENITLGEVLTSARQMAAGNANRGIDKSTGTESIASAE